MESIVTSIKKLLGITEEDTSFDSDVMMHINSVLMILNQLGVGPDSGFAIKSNAETWSDFLYSSVDVEAVKTYVYLKVRLIFDPPNSSATLDSMKRLADELEWRIKTQVETKSEGVL